LKLAIGGAQFGLDYGLSNKNKRTKLDELIKILDFCLTEKVTVIDTAMAYGNSEKQLGLAGVKGFKIITKLPAGINRINIDIYSYISSLIEKSLKELNVTKIYGLLLHQSMDLMSKNGEIIYKCLEDLKSQNIISKIGISIYDPHELESLIPNFGLDIVQAPYNLIDRRIEDTQWIIKLEKKKTQLYTRSVFLQGLLLMNKDNRPKYFKKWSSLFDNIDNHLIKNKLSPLEHSLNAVMHNKSIERLIVGVENLKQIKSIVKVLKKNKMTEINKSFFNNDAMLINPSKWQ
jgi:aryl-alcohol dehydrogenase-like predicted oxidoreductase